MGTTNPLQANVASRPNAAQSARTSAPLLQSPDGATLTGLGLKTALNKTAGASVVQVGVGRICKVFVNTAGSTPGQVNDCATTGAVAAGNLVAVIPNVVGIYPIDCPVTAGLVLTAGTGQVLSISYQ